MTMMDKLVQNRYRSGKWPAWFRKLPEDTTGQLFRLLVVGANHCCHSSVILLRKLFMQYKVTGALGWMGLPGSDFTFLLEDSKGHELLLCFDYQPRVGEEYAVAYFLFPNAPARVDYKLERWYKAANRKVVPGYTTGPQLYCVGRYALMDYTKGPLYFNQDVNYKDVLRFIEYLGKFQYEEIQCPKTSLQQYREMERGLCN